MRSEWEPIHTDALDADLRMCWRLLPPSPPGLMLTGGTALALYCGHRQSCDLDWLAMPPLQVAEPTIAELPMFANSPDLTLSSLTGGPGLVDCELHLPSDLRPTRSIRMTFMEPLPRVFPTPQREPIIAPNGIAVMHPIDTLAGKLKAVATRETLRDYQDAAWFAQHAPDELEAAVHQLRDQRELTLDRCQRYLLSPPPQVAEWLDGLEALQRFAAGLDADDGDHELGR